MPERTLAATPAPSLERAGAAVRVAPVDLALLAAIPVLTFLDLLERQRWAVWAVLLLALCFVLRHAGHVTPRSSRTALLLGVVTAALLPLLPDPLAAIERGLRIGALIAALLVSIHLLSRSVARTPQARSVMDDLHRVAPGRRYLALSVASQCFGGLLGLAGVAMLMESAARQERDTPGEQLSAFSAITRGYAALSLWSPMYSNMGIVLAMYEGAQWAAVLPVALAVTALFVALGAALDALAAVGRPRAAPAWPAVPAGVLVRQGWPVVLAMSGFLAVMVAASRGLGLPIAAVIIAAAPLAAWLLHARLLGGHGAVAAATRQVGVDLGSFRSMSGEVLMFMASGCAGTVIGAAIPPAWIAVVGAAVGGSPELACLAVSSAIVLLSACALHPMLSAVIVGASLGPAQVGLPVLPHLSAVLVGWGLAIIVTPFSVVSTLAARWSGIPVMVVSLRANAAFVVLALGMSAGLLGWLARALEH